MRSNALMLQIENAKQKAKGYFPVFVGSMIFSVVIYSLLMSERLVNPYDGLWYYSYKYDGSWEVSIGRWLLFYFYRLCSGISIDPMTSFLALMFFSLGVILLLDIFGIRSGISPYLICCLFLSNAVICTTLSYRFISASYGLAFLLSILAVWAIAKIEKAFAAIMLGALSVTLALGIYQAYLGCTCVVAFGYFLFILSGVESTTRTVLRKAIRCGLAIFLGGILYAILSNLFLGIMDFEVPSYRGASDISFSNMFLELPSTVPKTYQEFFNFFSGKDAKTILLLGGNVSAGKVYLLTFLLISCRLICEIIRLWKKECARAVIYAGIVLLMPIACNAILLIATDTYISMQMSMPLALCIPTLLCVVSRTDRSGTFFDIYKCFILFIAAVVAYGSICQVAADQQAMHEGETSTVTIANEVIHRLDDRGVLSPEMTYCIVGNLVENGLFEVSPGFNMANWYARFGHWDESPESRTWGWDGVFKHLCGVNLNICSLDKYAEIADDEEIKNMPVFPAEDSILVKDDVVIIKISDDY